MTTTTPTQKKPHVGQKKRTVFLRRLSECGQVRVAARAAEVDVSNLYKQRKIDEEFAGLWLEAIDIAMMGAESEVYRRAVDGTDKPITVAGEREIIREYSDPLIMFLLKAHKPEKYRDNYKGNPDSDPDTDRWASDTDPLFRETNPLFRETNPLFRDANPVLEDIDAST